MESSGCVPHARRVTVHGRRQVGEHITNLAEQIAPKVSADTYGPFPARAHPQYIVDLHRRLHWRCTCSGCVLARAREGGRAREARHYASSAAPASQPTRLTEPNLAL